MLAERSINVEPQQVLLTQGANDALDMIVRHFIEPGDPVLVDNPGYYPLFGKLRLAKAQLVGVRRTPDGPDLDDLAAQAARTGARIFFTQSLAHNPTGCSITLPVAYRLMRIATEHNLMIVDSDPFADVLPVTSPRLAALDQLDRVIYVGTFAKTLSASLRSGYIAARADIVGALADLKMITRANSSGYIEQIIYRSDFQRALSRPSQTSDRPHRGCDTSGLRQPVTAEAVRCSASRAAASTCGANCPSISTTSSFRASPPNAAFFWRRDRRSARMAHHRVRPCASTSRTWAIHALKPSWLNRCRHRNQHYGVACSHWRRKPIEIHGNAATTINPISSASR